MEQWKYSVFLTSIMSTRINVNMKTHSTLEEKANKIQWKIFIFICKHAQNRIHSNEIRDIMKRKQTHGTMIIRRLALCDDLLGSVFNVIGWCEMTKVGNLCFVKVISLFFFACSDETRNTQKMWVENFHRITFHKENHTQKEFFILKQQNVFP